MQNEVIYKPSPRFPPIFSYLCSIKPKYFMEQSDILRNLRIEQLTPMQEAARDAYQSDKDLVLLSPTGSGKTLAAFLWSIDQLLAAKSPAGSPDGSSPGGTAAPVM